MNAEPQQPTLKTISDPSEPQPAWLTLPPILDSGDDFENALRALRGPLIVVDASRVIRLTSSGVLAMQRFLHELKTLDTTPVVVGASQPFIAQLNVSQPLASHVAVFSVLAPYFCQDCEREQWLERVVPQEPSVPEHDPVQCANCQGEALFDDVEAVFYRFLQYTMTCDVPHVAHRLAQSALANHATAENATAENATAENATAERGTGLPKRVTSVGPSSMAVHAAPLQQQSWLNSPLTHPASPAEPLDARAVPAGEEDKTRSKKEPHTQIEPTGAQTRLDWTDLVFYTLSGALLAGLALVIMHWWTS